MKVKKIPVPAGSLIGKMPGADYTDAFRVEFERDIPASADDLSVAFWTDRPTWVERLFRWRNAVVRVVGLKGGSPGDDGALEKCIREGGRYGLFEQAGKNAEETVLLLKDKHLNAYMSVIKQHEAVTVCTVVHYHNALGRIYFWVIRPFHGWVVRGMLYRAVKKYSPQ